MQIKEKIEEFKQLFHYSSDLSIREFENLNKVKCALIFLDNAVDELLLSQSVIEPLQKLQFIESSIQNVELCQQQIIAYTQVESVDDKQQQIDAILSGFAILLIDNCPTVTKIECAKWVTRLPSEPPTSAVIRGPREGFVEDINTNLSLLRKRIRTNDFVIKEFTIGKLTKTQVKICYLDNVASPTIIKEIEQKIQRIDIDGIIDSSYIAGFLGHNKHSLFKQIGTTEKPDIATAKILEGRIAILVDGSPIALTLPYILIEDLQSSDDYYSTPAKATFLRWLRLLGGIISIMLPGVYVALLLYHYQIIPIKFLITINNSIQGIPLPPFLEVLFIIFLFETLYEASLRMPRYLGLALSVVGALILGDTAVKAGLISPPAVLIVAVTGVMSYTIPEQSSQITLLRLIFTFVGGILGLYGIIVGAMILITYVCNLDNYQSSYLAPFAPFISSDQKDALSKKPITEQTTRPQSIPNINKRRLKNDRKNNIS